MIGFPPCKINLGLRVVRKRDDGYHDIETCFYPLPFTDVLEVVPADVFRFHQSGLSLPGSADDNLCVKAYRLLKQRYHLPHVAIYLHKLVPPGAGLGGGSSDAAWMLRLLHRMFDLPADYRELVSLAGQLGSDCTFFMHDRAMLGFGRGEILEPAEVSLKGYYLILAKPNVHVSTAEAYGMISPGPPAVPLRQILQNKPETWRSVLVNDFENPVIRRYPVISQLKGALYRHGALYASMTGSGSAVYGIFRTRPDTDNDLGNYVIWEGEL
ncbi:MAG: 4-(cytidine 5'-diphospho)-2-C-methyl-D-erythritol kinase [Cyclobacteriaceae bacterium]|nr:4-(cytidine 5'-diphospho)-2-C-methyl-D-erythritol kinase [Cyclobacteriaceae bacterium]